MQVILPSGYLSRKVTLVAQKRFPKRLWDLRAVDGAGCSFPVVARGPTEGFRSLRAAEAALPPPGERSLWATSDRARVDVCA